MDAAGDTQHHCDSVTAISFRSLLEPAYFDWIDCVLFSDRLETSTFLRWMVLNLLSCGVPLFVFF